jgi:hypothetical protein
LELDAQRNPTLAYHKCTAFQHIRHLRRWAAFFTTHLQCHYQQSQRCSMALHTNSHTSDSGAVWQEGRRAILGAKSKLMYRETAVSETVQNRTCTYMLFCFRLTCTMTSLNIDLSSWGILYSRLKVEFCNFLVMTVVYVTNWQ